MFNRDFHTQCADLSFNRISCIDIIRSIARKVCMPRKSHFCARPQKEYILRIVYDIRCEIVDEKKKKSKRLEENGTLRKLFGGNGIFIISLC